MEAKHSIVFQALQAIMMHTEVWKPLVYNIKFVIHKNLLRIWQNKEIITKNQEWCLCQKLQLWLNVTSQSRTNISGLEGAQPLLRSLPAEPRNTSLSTWEPPHRVCGLRPMSWGFSFSWVLTKSSSSVWACNRAKWKRSALKSGKPVMENQLG